MNFNGMPFRYFSCFDGPRHSQKESIYYPILPVLLKIKKKKNGTGHTFMRVSDLQTRFSADRLSGTAEGSE